MNYITVAAAILIGNLSIATAHGEHQQQQQHNTVAVAHGSHNNKYQQHEPLGLGYRTRYNTLTPPVAIIGTSYQLYLGPPPPPSSHAAKTFEDSEFNTSSSSSSSSHYHHHHSDNNIDGISSSSSISFAKSKAQQSQQQQQSLVNINKHRIFTKSLRQTIGPPVNDGCDGASVIEPLGR